MAFGGGTPEPVGTQLNCSYKRAAAGMHGAKYYLCGVGSDGAAEIVVYDTERGLWSREDETEAVGFSSDAGTLYLLDASGGLWECGTDDPVEWEAVFGPFENVQPGKRIGSKIDLALTAERGAVLRLDIRSDGCCWRNVWSGAARSRDGVVRAPFLPVRGHGFSVRLRGTGRATLRAINRRFKSGSDR